MEKIEAIFIGIGIVIGGAIIFFYRKCRQALLDIFDGHVDKIELGGIIFTICFCWMIYKEGTRTHEWSCFSELQVLFVASAATTGLGLNSVLEHIKSVKQIRKDQAVEVQDSKTEGVIAKANADEEIK